MKLEKSSGNFQSCVHHGIAEDKCKCSLVASVNPKRYDICTAKVIRTCVIPEFYNPDQHLQVEVGQIDDICESRYSMTIAEMQHQMQTALQILGIHEATELCTIVDKYGKRLNNLIQIHRVVNFFDSIVLSIGGKLLISQVSKLTNGTQKESLKRTIILDIFYEQLEYTTIKHVVAMPLPSLIAQIGGVDL